MPDIKDQFQRAPRRKASKGKRVAVSAEAKEAYAALIEERVKREQEYARHLPGTEKPR